MQRRRMLRARPGSGDALQFLKAGIAEMLALCESHWEAATVSRLRQTRADQAAAWLREAVRTRFGNAGLETAGDAAGIARSATPFLQTCNLLARLRVTCKIDDQESLG